MKTIHTDKAPAAIGPYSQAKQTGNLLFVSGQTPVHPETGIIPETIEEQAHQTCKNVQAIVEAAGATLEQVVKANCYLHDMADFKAFNRVYQEYFTGKPARACVAVKGLPLDVLVEIEVIVEMQE